MVLFSITSHPPAITLGASLDWFGQETQEECSLEAMTEAYEGETTKKNDRVDQEQTSYTEICCIYNMWSSVYIYIYHIFI